MSEGAGRGGEMRQRRRGGVVLQDASALVLPSTSNESLKQNMSLNFISSAYFDNNLLICDDRKKS